MDRFMHLLGLFFLVMGYATVASGNNANLGSGYMATTVDSPYVAGEFSARAKGVKLDGSTFGMTETMVSAIAWHDSNDDDFSKAFMATIEYAEKLIESGALDQNDLNLGHKDGMVILGKDATAITEGVQMRYGTSGFVRNESKSNFKKYSVGYDMEEYFGKGDAVAIPGFQNPYGSKAVVMGDLKPHLKGEIFDGFVFGDVGKYLGKDVMDVIAGVQKQYESKAFFLDDLKPHLKFETYGVEVIR